MRARDDMVGTVTVKGFVSYIFDDSVSSNYLIENGDLYVGLPGEFGLVLVVHRSLITEIIT